MLTIKEGTSDALGAPSLSHIVAKSLSWIEALNRAIVDNRVVVLAEVSFALMWVRKRLTRLH